MLMYSWYCEYHQMYHNDSNISKEQNLIWRHQSEQIHTHTNGRPPHYLQIVHIQRVLIYLVVCKGHSFDIGVHESRQFHDSNDRHQSPIHRPPGLCTWHNLVDDQSSCYRWVMAHHKVRPKSTESKQQTNGSLTWVGKLWHVSIKIETNKQMDHYF